MKSENLNECKNLLPIEELYEAHLLKKNEVKQDRDTDGAFHPSQMGGCTRKLWYAACMFEPRHRIDAKLRNTFNHGHAVHDWQQAELADLLENLNAREGGPRYSAKFEVSLSDKDVCEPAELQELESDTFQGLTLAEDLNIKGRADGLIVITDTDGTEFRVIYELKTMADASWKKLTKPMVKHVAQTSIYAECLGATAVLFQYYNKNADTSKWFWSVPDEGAWEAVLGQIKTVRAALSAGTDVPANYSMWECKSCGYYHDCKPEQR
jgi:CRISPR/Cas system-associated exonuclease Cas4 (RecB family)